MEHAGDSDTYCSWCSWNDSQRIRKAFWKVGNRRKNSGPFRQQDCWDRPEYWRPQEMFRHWESSESKPANAGVKNSQEVWDETINHIISECSKLTQKEYKTRHNWVGKVIHWEMYKKLKFDHTNKRYMHNPASVLENDTRKLLWNFDIQTDHLISARRPDLIIIIINKKRKKKKKETKENLQNCRFCCPGWPRNKTERMWKEG